jgi:PPM family protein phosphatase
MRFSIFQDSAVGGRANNQDRMGYAFTRDCIMMVVADGLGGHFGGEIAAQITTKIIAEQFEMFAKPNLRDPGFFLAAALKTAHREILSETIEKQYPDTPRTTVAACVIQDGFAWWAHAGDSRCYLYRDGLLKTRTRDHSKLETLVSLGLLDPSQTERHPDRNKVLNCLGIEIEPIIEVSQPMALQAGDLILLCSDGVWSAGGDQQFAVGLKQRNLSESLPHLVHECIEKNGRTADNATAVALIWEQPDGLTVPTDISSDWLPKGAVTSTILACAPEAAADVSHLSDDEIQKTIDEIRTAIASVDSKPRR